MSLDFEIDTTVLFHRVKGDIVQIAQLQLPEKISREKAKLILQTSIWEREFDILCQNSKSIFIDIPPLEFDTNCKACLLVGRERIEKEVVLRARRRWEVHIQNFSHTDIGYTDLPSRVIRGYRSAIELIIRFCKETAGFPLYARYKWNVETGYWLENALEGLSPNRLNALKEFIREGLIEITPLYVAHTSEFNDEETLIRSLYFGFDFARKCGVKIKTAIASDSTGQPWMLAQLLTKTGIKYFSTAVNIAMAKALELPRPFYWKSLDGSRILVMDTDERQAYQEGVMVGVNKSYSTLLMKLPKYLKELEDNNRYAFDLIALRNTGYEGDNTQPNINICNVVKEWNNNWEYPKLIISTYTSFFEKFEERYGSKLETYYGAWPDWWVNYHGACAFETGINRYTHGRILEAERLSSLLKIIGGESYLYQKNELKEIYKKMLLADEADWSSFSSVSEPDGLQSRGQRFEEATFVYQAAINAEEVSDKAKLTIAKIGSSGTKYSLVVINPLSWDRSETVEVSVPKKILMEAKEFRIVDPISGEEVAAQIIKPTERDRQSGKIRVAFCTQKVPAIGFKVYHFIVDRKAEQPEYIVTEPRYRNSSIDNCGYVANDFYEVKYDPVTGLVYSIIDRGNGKQLIDHCSCFRFNQLVYESTKEKRRVDLSRHGEIPEDTLYLQDYFKSIYDFYHFPKQDTVFVRWSPGDQRVESVTEGKIYSEIVTSSSTYMCPVVKSHFILDNFTKRIVIQNYIFKHETLDVEAVYYAFPFNFKNPVIELNCHGGFFEPEKEQLPGSCKDWYCIQKWLDISDDVLDVIWSPLEAPLVQLCDINTGKWLDKLVVRNGTILSFVMNNHWWTNSPASQSGRYWFNYYIASANPPFDPVRAHRFGWSQHIPLSAVFVEQSDKDEKVLCKLSGKMVKQYGLLQGIPDNVVVVCLKQAEYDSGFVLRLLEICGHETNFSLTFENFKVERAYVVTPVEDRISRISHQASKIDVVLKPFELISLWVDLS